MSLQKFPIDRPAVHRWKKATVHDALLIKIRWALHKQGGSSERRDYAWHFNRPIALLTLLVLCAMMTGVVGMRLVYAGDASPLSLPLSAPQLHRASVEPAAASALSMWLARALPETTHVAVVQFLDAESHWNTTGTTIVTAQRLAVLQPLLGTMPDVITVETTGGYLAAESIGLWVSHGIDIVSDVPQLLLLAADTGTYRIVGDDRGVFTLAGDQVTNSHLGIQMPTATFINLLNQEVSRQERGEHLAALPRIAALSGGSTAHLAAEDGTPIPFDHHVSGNGDSDDSPRWVVSSVALDIKVNINSTQIDDQIRPRGDFYSSIVRALRTWSVVEEADFTLLYAGETDATTIGYDGINEIVFVAEGRNRPLGQAQIWYTTNNTIVEVDMWLNDDYELNVGDSEPAFGEIDLESVVLHELGHWVPLGHDANADAVMYSVLGPQQTKRTLTTFDVDRLVDLYPCAVPPCIDASYEGELATPTSTPVPPTATATPTLSPTVATPTLIATTSPDSHAIYLPMVAR